jgi:hypothetical protein
MFGTNEGGLDRAVRGLIGLALIGTLLATNALTGGLAIAAWVVAIVMLGTAATGFCGLYALLGISTCKTQ